MSITRKAGIALMVLLTFALVLWLFACAYSYGTASFDCADRAGDIATCVRAIHRTVLLQAGAAIAVWALAAWLTFRNRGR